MRTRIFASCALTLALLGPATAADDLNTTGYFQFAPVPAPTDIFRVRNATGELVMAIRPDGSIDVRGNPKRAARAFFRELRKLTGRAFRTCAARERRTARRLRAQ